MNNNGKHIMAGPKKTHHLKLRAMFCFGLLIPIWLCLSTGMEAFGASDPGFTSMEKDWIRNHPELRLVVNSAPPPISMWGDLPPAGPQGPDSNGPHRPPPRLLTRPPGTAPGAYHGKPPGPESVPHRTDRPLVPVGPGQQGMFRGLAADTLEEISAITGITFVVVLKADSNFTAMEGALTKGKADIFPTVILDRDMPVRGPLTRPYVNIPIVIVTRPETPFIDDISVLQSMRLVGTRSVPPRLERIGLSLRLRMLPLPIGLRGVATGKFDAFIGELSGVTDILSHEPVGNIKISGEMPFSSQFVMAVAAGKEPFVPIFNKAFDAISTEKKDAIWQKWFPVRYQKSWDSSPWIRAAAAGGGLLLFAVSVAALYYRRRFTRIKSAIADLDPHLLSLRLDNNIVITEATEAFCKATGFETDDIVGKPLMALGSADKDSEHSLTRAWQSLKHGKSWKGEIKIQRKDGSALWARAVVSPLRRKTEEKGGYTVICQDVTRQKHFENLAIRDALTGLYNRRDFNTTAPDLLRNARKAKQVFALILIDVDHFKKYNDTYGHPAGDQTLETIGKTLKDTLQRENDKVFRLGGEEFGAAILVADSKDARAIGEKVLEGIRALNIPHKSNPPGVVTVSIGIGTSEDDSADGNLESIYQRADKALYRAKNDGRDRVVVSNRKDG